VFVFIGLFIGGALSGWLFGPVQGGNAERPHTPVRWLFATAAASWATGAMARGCQRPGAFGGAVIGRQLGVLFAVRRLRRGLFCAAA
jgi:hypothetical protein